ncbi:MAG: riboflavin synthase [Candidatus Marinimicrobia bacterium]|nr:riboflavin synthase [Candidatus Neomarinimicrobiota bacterium]|tara:strand:+ start:33653 stop:34249 length:597 start_codon:yes stop_codon:yes gene_type:complete
MFTGIIEELARVKSIDKIDNFYTVQIASAFSDEINIGDSISVNGVCLTAKKIGDSFFEVDIIKETLDKSSLKTISNKSYVNLERSMKVSSRIDGHIVQGHVESVAEIVDLKSFDNQTNFTIEIDENYLKYCIKKGSITLDGISLTIAEIKNNHITVAIIPHTLDNTTLKFKKIGDFVNLETDMFAKYVENILRVKNNE